MRGKKRNCFVLGIREGDNEKTRSWSAATTSVGLFLRQGRQLISRRESVDQENFNLPIRIEDGHDEEQSRDNNRRHKNHFFCPAF